MADQWTVDSSNQQQIKEYAVQTGAAADGTRMGAKAVSVTGSPAMSANGATAATSSELMAGKASDGKQYPLSIDQSGGLLRYTQEQQFLNAVAITDTANHDSVYFDLSSMRGRKYLHVVNSLNQSAAVSLIVNTKGQLGSIIAGSKTLSGFGVITATDIPSLADPLAQVKVRAVCSVAPTSGSISVWMEGE